MFDVETLVERYGYTREAAEKEVQRANCEHDFGHMCSSSPFGCVRTCEKCGQMQGLGGHCWELKKKREAAEPNSTDQGTKR